MIQRNILRQWLSFKHFLFHSDQCLKATVHVEVCRTQMLLKQPETTFMPVSQHKSHKKRQLDKIWFTHAVTLLLLQRIGYLFKDSLNLTIECKEDHKVLKHQRDWNIVYCQNSCKNVSHIALPKIVQVQIRHYHKGVTIASRQRRFRHLILTTRKV